jgi:ligand-binding sensor domain-containing protein
MKRIHVLLALLLCAGVQLIGGRQAPMVSAGRDESQPDVAEDVIWTKWGADHYAMADDGDSIWIGTASGLIRWNKFDSSYTRYSTADGLPHRDVLAVAVDGQGNRWFGGDGWLSRLDPAEKWTLFDLAGIGLPASPVDGIAAGTDGILWLSHLDSANISQLNPDGTWVLYSDRKTAVAAKYQQIKLTANKNSLWTVSGDGVWVGYDRYDGASWQTFTPPQASGSPLVVDADSLGNIWFLCDWARISVWNGHEWLEYPLEFFFFGAANTLVVGENDEVWIGWEGSYPYGTTAVGIARVPDTPGTIFLGDLFNAPPPVVALWPTQEGLWGIGPGWLLLPDGGKRFTDVPFHENVGSVVFDRQGRTWIYSTYTDIVYNTGVMQTFDDNGTPTMTDDESKVWSSLWILDAIEPAPDGDLWISWEYNLRYRASYLPQRFHGESVITYARPPSEVFVCDIFVQDDRHVWFAYGSGIWSFDDGGTPFDTDDDAWQTLEPPPWGACIVAVQGDQIWIGNNQGLYLYDGAGWEQFSTRWVTDLVPASDGSLFVGMGDSVLIIEPDGQQSIRAIVGLITNDLARVRRTQRRNRMWTVAPDGGVWYWKETWQLARQGEAGLQVYQAPVDSGFIEVDEHNNVWLTADGSLWRMSPRPDFDLELQPQFLWYIPADGTRLVATNVVGFNGFIEPVTLTVEGLPAGVSATVEPNPMPPGGQATLLLTSAAAALGEYEGTIQGHSNFWTRQQSFKLVVVERVYDAFLPLIAH